MNLTENVKKSTIAVLDNIQKVTPSLSTGRQRDVFSLVAFDYDLTPVNFAGNKRLKGQFDIQFLVSPQPGNKKTLLSYGEIVSYFDANYFSTFNTNGVNPLWVRYGQSTLITDKTTGDTSLVFTINIEAVEKRE
ncbi:hypothetical protein VC636_25650 [Citrobacter freundii]|uniref:hypothetical protein n=1 Tax=Citrobacter freundii TaxID=546 RepID=UPI00292B3EBC|nr:hypothetical protein [Citrobacter freundii]MDV0678316.1 hypothetical protein [Citrobacter freundii]MDV0860717.1 hypothetical protein [Citrobacter freundii]MEB0577849.1 hypothetical protein [Citrobacter freundii]MEB0714204.1 hypothetical protein [Citrobacter freundii]